MIQQLTPVFEELAKLILIVVIAMVTYGLRVLKVKASDWLDAHTNETQRRMVDMLAKEGWAYAEKMFAGAAGEEKMRQAIGYVYAEAAKRNIVLPIDAAGLQNLIEKAVMEFNAITKPIKVKVESGPAN